MFSYKCKYKTQCLKCQNNPNSELTRINCNIGDLLSNKLSKSIKVKVAF